MNGKQEIKKTKEIAYYICEETIKWKEDKSNYI